MYLENINNEPQKSIIGYCARKDKDEYFLLPNKTDDKLKDCVIMSVYFAFNENDEKIWERFSKAKKLNMNLHFKYKNSFQIQAESSIKITWTTPKNQNRYKNFKTTDYFIYETKIH